MRQTRSPGQVVDLIEIELIEADSSAFGAPATAPRPPRARRPRPRWLVPAVLGALGAIAVALFVWQPWRIPLEWRMFPAPEPSPAELSNQLLPAEPPGLLLSVVEPASVGSGSPTVGVGYVFAEPGAVYGFRRSALFEATPTNRRDAERVDGRDDSPSALTVNGQPAALDRFRMRSELTWGPRGGYTWRTFTNALSEDEVLDFANAVGAPDGTAALRSGYRLDDLVPVGTMSAYTSAFALRNALTDSQVLSPLRPTVVTYLDEQDRELRVASVPAPSDAMQLVEFMFGDGDTTTIHGIPALFIESREAGELIIWLEGGRLITVAGDLDETALREVAESVGTVSSAAWQRAGESANGWITLTASAPMDVGSGTSIDGVPWRVSVSVGNPTVTCFYLGSDIVLSSCTFSTPRVPATRTFPGPTDGTLFVVAIVAIDEPRPALRVTRSDGMITDHTLARLDDEYAGVAVEIAADATYSLVDPSA